MERDNRSILNHTANREGITVDKQDTETSRIIITNAKNRGKRIDPIPDPDSTPNHDLERWLREQERKKNNRRTVICVWLITALLLFAAGGFALWQSGALKTISLADKKTNPARTGFLHIGLPQINTANNGGMKKLPALAGDVAQVEVLYSDAVVVLRTDGTVDVAGNSELAAKAASWDNIVKIIPGSDSIAGVRADGSAVCTICDISGWTDIEDLYIHWGGIAGIKTDGTVVTAGTWEDEYDPSGWKNIKKLYDLGEYATIGLKRDGTVLISDPQNHSEVTEWNNVEEMYGLEGYQICARQNDGSFINTIEEDMSGLKGCIKIAIDRFVFGVSPDGRLHTQTGKLYTDGGEIHVECQEPYYEEIDLSRYTNIRDIVGGPGIIMLKKDGTVDWIDHWTSWDFRSWNQIERIYTDWYGHAYGIRKDSSVIVANSQDGTSRSNYMEWKLKELFIGDGGVVGLTTDGRLVGDGAFSGDFLKGLN